MASRSVTSSGSVNEARSPGKVDGMDPASEKQKWHDWAADKIADVGDGFTSEFMKLSDEELRAELDSLIATLVKTDAVEK